MIATIDTLSAYCHYGDFAGYSFEPYAAKAPAVVTNKESTHSMNPLTRFQPNEDSSFPKNGGFVLGEIPTTASDVAPKEEQRNLARKKRRRESNRRAA